MHIDRTRASGIMSDAGITALLATRFENVFYLSGYDRHDTYSYGGRIVAVLPSDLASPPVVLISKNELAYLIHHPVRDCGIRSYGQFFLHAEPDAHLRREEEQLQHLYSATQATHADTWVEGAARILDDLGVADTCMGVDDLQAGQRLAARLSQLRIVDATEVFQRLRMIKSKHEVEKLRRAAAINEEAQRIAFESAGIGVTWEQVCRSHRDAVTHLGGAPGHWLGSPGALSGAMFAPMDYALEPGDLVRLDVGASFEHYCSDTGRTGVIGRPSARQRDYYRALGSAMEDIVPLLRPGRLACDVFRDAVEAVRRAGIPQFRRTMCGHGIGLDVHEWPDIAPGCEIAIEQNMVINIELPYYELGWGGLQLEETFLVTCTGAEGLTTASRELYVCHG